MRRMSAANRERFNVSADVEGEGGASWTIGRWWNHADPRYATPDKPLRPGFRTLELYGQLGGQNVPLSQVLTEQGGGFAVVPGGVVLGGESPGEGFGYGGTPGRWTEASGGQPPTAFGQDAQLGIVGFDGARAWPVPASTLAQIFGTNWRGSLS